jgi:hypothetical protein
MGVAWRNEKCMQNLRRKREGKMQLEDLGIDGIFKMF